MKSLFLKTKEIILDSHFLALNLIRQKHLTKWEKVFSHNICLGSIRFFLRLFKHIIIDIVNVSKIKILINEILFIVGSKNNYDALFPVYEQLKRKSDIVSIGNFTFKESILFPISICYIVSFILMPYSIIIYYTLDYDVRNKLKVEFSDYLLSFGFFFVWFFLLSFLKSKLVIMSNDHWFTFRIINKVALLKKRKTIYIQHASISDEHPKLEFTLSLLEGTDARRKYISKDSDPLRIKLIGMPKYDKWYNEIYVRTNIRRIGVCLNRITSLEMFKDVVLFLKEKNLVITIRPHPGEITKTIIKYCKKNQIIFSDSNKIDVFTFLQGQDAIIAGNSSILLEASLLNVYPIYFNFGSEFYDWYGYAKNGLAHEVKNLNELRNLIKKLERKVPLVRKKAKYYNDVLFTEREGRSSELAAKYILEEMS